MKVSKEDLSREHVWKVADVRNIPDGWRREVWYDTETEELYGVLLSGGESYEPPKTHIYLDTFVSLAKFWTEYPYSAEDLELEVDEDGCPREEDLEDIYMEEWWDEFEFPVIPLFREEGEEE
jgi:hypothetical protein